MQSDLLPSACIVELPSKPQRGISASEGVEANSLIWVFPRSSGMGFLPSSQMYSSLYFAIALLRDAKDARYARQGYCLIHKDFVKIRVRRHTSAGPGRVAAKLVQIAQQK